MEFSLSAKRACLTVVVGEMATLKICGKLLHPSHALGLVYRLMRQTQGG